MLNLIYADLYKLSKSNAFKVCVIIAYVAAVALVYISHAVAIGDMSAAISSSASGLGDILIISVLGALMAGIFICGDFETKTIHDAVACGNGRIAVVISKALVYAIVVAALVLPYGVVTVVAFLMDTEFATPFVMSPFLTILANDGGYDVSAPVIGKIIILSMIGMLVYAARLSFCLPLAFKLRKPVVVMAIGNVVCFLVDLVIGLFVDVPILGKILTYTPYSMGITELTLDAEVGTLLKVIGVSIIFYIIMTAITYWIFRKSEIK